MIRESGEDEYEYRYERQDGEGDENQREKHLFGHTSPSTLLITFGFEGEPAEDGEEQNRRQDYESPERLASPEDESYHVYETEGEKREHDE